MNTNNNKTNALVKAVIFTTFIGSILSGCSPMVVSGDYTIDSSVSLFDDKTTLRLSSIELMDYPGVTTLPKAKISLAQLPDNGRSLALWIYLDEITKINQVRVNIDNHISALSSPSSDTIYLTKEESTDWSLRSFSLTQKMLHDITEGKTVRIQIITDKGPIDKVFSMEQASLPQKAFKDFEARMNP